MGEFVKGDGGFFVKNECPAAMDRGRTGFTVRRGYGTTRRGNRAETPRGYVRSPLRSCYCTGLSIRRFPFRTQTVTRPLDPVHSNCYDGLRRGLCHGLPRNRLRMPMLFYPRGSGCTKRCLPTVRAWGYYRNPPVRTAFVPCVVRYRPPPRRRCFRRTRA